MLTAYYLLTVDGLRVSIPLELLCGGMNIEKSWGDFRWDPEKQFWLSHHQNIDLLINKRHPLASSSSSDTSAGVSTVILDGHHDLCCRVNGTLYSRSSLMICWSEKKRMSYVEGEWQNKIENDYFSLEKKGQRRHEIFWGHGQNAR